MSNELPPPDVLTLLVCDQIITDRMTGKQSIIGIFSRIHVRRFPAAHPVLCVFVMLTEGRGRTELSIRIVDANESRKPLVEGNGAVEFKDPRAVANLALQFHGLTFPEAGDYRVQLWSSDSLLREARLELVEVQPRPDGQPPETPPPV